jgi:hypothetical protein
MVLRPRRDHCRYEDGGEPTSSWDDEDNQAPPPPCRKLIQVRRWSQQENHFHHRKEATPARGGATRERFDVLILKTAEFAQQITNTIAFHFQISTFNSLLDSSAAKRLLPTCQVRRFK